MSTKNGPGYASPLDAYNKGPREEILYVVCVQPNPTENKTDFLATVDVNPKSSTYCQIIHRTYTGHIDDEIHHSGWNICSSCHDCSMAPQRDKLVLPCLNSDRIIFIDTGKHPKAPTVHKVIDAKDLHALDCSAPHAVHCLASGEIMISVLAQKDGTGKGDFILIDGKTLEVKEKWPKGRLAKFGYDFWYQPYHDVMISTGWGAPKYFKNGFDPAHLNDPNAYGTTLNFWNWTSRELIQTIDLGPDGFCPLEVRFLHNPKEPQGFVGCAVNANVYRFYRKDDGVWQADKVIDVKQKKVSGWPLPYMQGMISDILISLDDKYLYLNNWFHGDVRQYDITDRANPKFTGSVYLGGLIVSDSAIKVTHDDEWLQVPNPVYVKGKRLTGGPQMMQLSLDGKRLYVSNSLFSAWDKQFFPDMVKEGGYIVKVDCDVKNGGMKLDENFLVNFGMGPDGPVLSHEMRYPGGDCTSDIWLAK